MYMLKDKPLTKRQQLINALRERIADRERLLVRWNEGSAIGHWLRERIEEDEDAARLLSAGWRPGFPIVAGGIHSDDIEDSRYEPDDGGF